MRVLVTGGSGLVGKYVADDLAQSHSVEILDLKRPQRTDLPFHRIDLLDYSSTELSVKDYDVIVHLAGIPHPLNDPAEEIFRTNTVGTFNLLEACRVNGIRRVIFLSSESTLGLAFSSSRMWPEYVPIDEEHPLRPEDPYGLSKVVGELLCESFSQRSGMQTICLRPPWIWVPERAEIEQYRQLIAQHPKWSKNLWAYIHVRDVAQAVRRCLESPGLPAHDRYFISAADTWTEVDSRKLLADYFPETKRIAPGFSGSASFINFEKARRTFGFCPRYTWRDIVTA
jgi:nucleoside-diphosphate-sugar epimerase